MGRLDAGKLHTRVVVSVAEATNGNGGSGERLLQQTPKSFLEKETDQ